MSRTISVGIADFSDFSLRRAPETDNSVGSAQEAWLKGIQMCLDSLRQHQPTTVGGTMSDSLTVVREVAASTSIKMVTAWLTAFRHDSARHFKSNGESERPGMRGVTLNSDDHADLSNLNKFRARMNEPSALANPNRAD